MTDRSKFEEMLERLVNEDRAAAEELFHEIVVEKSREIYQSIIESEEDDLDESDDEESDDELDENADEDDEDDKVDESEEDDLDESEEDDLDEMFGLDEFELEADPMSMMGGDATDDMMGDMGMDDEGDMDMDMGDEGGEGGADDAFADLEDALEALKAEFEAMMGGADEEGDDDEGDEDEGDDEEGEEEPEKEAFAFEAKKADEKKKADDKKKADAKKTAGEQMREYVEKVAPAKMGDNGTNAKSIVASKNDMGGTTANILRTDTENSGEANKGQLKGNGVFKGTPKEDNAGNINVPGGKAGKTAFKKSEPGHGAEKKGKPETADKGAGSLIKTTVRNK